MVGDRVKLNHTNTGIFEDMNHLEELDKTIEYFVAKSWKAVTAHNTVFHAAGRLKPILGSPEGFRGSGIRRTNLRG